MMNNQAVIVATGHLQEGLAAALTHFVYAHGGEITDFNQYVDTEASPKQYASRISWSLDGFHIPHHDLQRRLDEEITAKFSVKIDVRTYLRPTKIAIMVTRELPCLYAILLKCLSNEWYALPSLIISNRKDLEAEAQRFNIPFFYIPVTPQTRDSQGDLALQVLKEHNIDLVVLAKYMQIVPPNMVSAFGQKMINIHHSMLPAFVGAKPYHQAREYGVKFIGATAHYVVDELDQGPIIAQGMKEINHKKTTQELVMLGKSIEAEVLTKAISLHLEHRITLSGRRTIVLDD
jgi:formyltetrahydrofolate deformylase